MTVDADSLIRRGWALVMARNSLCNPETPFCVAAVCSRLWESNISFGESGYAVNVGTPTITPA